MINFIRGEEGGAGGGGVMALKALIDDGRGGDRKLTQLSVRGLGLTCASMLQVKRGFGCCLLFIVDVL